MSQNEAHLQPIFVLRVKQAQLEAFPFGRGDSDSRF